MAVYIYLLQPIINFIIVSSKFTFDSDLRVMENSSLETKEFVDAINFQISTVGRMTTELPLFRLYKNKLSRDFTEAVDVCRII